MACGIKAGVDTSSAPLLQKSGQLQHGKMVTSAASPPGSYGGEGACRGLFGTSSVPGVDTA